MAESKRIYEIKIEGLQESYEGVKSLREALNTLTDTVVNVSEQEQKTASTRKETAAGTDALAKATQKLNDWDRSYQTELALVNKELSNNKKEINDAIKLQEAQATVDAKQLDTYAQKQQYLSALNKLIRNHSTATEEDRAAIDRMVQESAKLQAELKATDEQMKIYVRNVGNYPGAAQMVVDSHKSIKLQLRELKEEMTSMLANGVSKTDEAYLKLAKRAGQLKDAMVDANKDITNFASDTRGLTNAINLATTAVSTYQLYNSALQVFGGQNEAAAESMRKMMAIMTMLNSLQQIQNNLLANGSASGRLYTKAVELIQAALGLKKTATEADIATTEASTAANEANAVSQEANAAANEASAVAEGVETAATEANTVATGANTGALGTNTGALGANATASQGAAAATNSMSVAQKAGAVASKTLSVALRAIPLVAIIGLVMALIQNWESIWNWFKKTFPVLDTLSKKFNKFGGLMNAIVSGAKAVAAAVMNWLVNPFKTFANVVGKILEGDFKGAWQAALDGLKNQFKGTVDAFKGEIVKGYARGQEEMTAKAAEESNKRTKQELAELKIQERNNKTYSKKYIELQKKDFEERKKMAKGNQEELNKIKLEEMQFEADIEDKKTAYAKSQANERVKNAKNAAKDAQKAAEDARKEYEELVKSLTKNIEDLEKLSDATEKKIYKGRDERAKAEQKRMFKNAQETLEYFQSKSMEIEKLSKKANKFNEMAYEAELDGLEHEAEIMQNTANSINAQIEGINELINNAEGDYKAFMDRIVFITAQRQETAVNNAAIEANELRKQFDNAIKDTEKDLEKLLKTTKLTADERQNVIDKAKFATRKEFDDFLKKLKDAGKLTDEALTSVSNAGDAVFRAYKNKVEEFGDYAQTLEVVIPINFDLDNLKERFDNIKPDFAFTDVINVISGVEGALENLYKKAEKSGQVFEVFRDLGNILGMARGETEDELDVLGDFIALATDTRPFEKKKDELQEILSQGTINISKFGLFGKTVSDNLKTVVDDTIKAINDEYKAFVSQQDKFISYHEKAIRKFQDATKDIKFEPVMENDILSKYFNGQILNMDKTKERYDKLKSAYETYQKTLKKGSEEREAYEEAWQQKLAATERHSILLKQLYGENSTEYKNAHMEYMLMIDEKKKADKAYEAEYEKVTQQIEEISKKQADLMYDYIESVANRIAGITKTIQDNVLSPIFDGLSDLFAFQLEEAQNALDEITDLYDKAVEARQESTDRMKQINDELRADEGQNKEALQQRLAEEEVLLVQREETERALEKEKKKRQYEVDLAEARQRKFELGQKLIEGIVNTALGATAALKYGFPMGPIFAAIITAFGALQTAIIAKQIGSVKMPQKYAAGGKVGEQGISRSHKQGGYRIEDTNIEVEGGEWVINRKSSQKYDSLLRSINDDKVGLVQKQVEIIRERRVINNNQPVRFADGGQINTLAATRAVTANNDITAITDLIKQIDFEPTVSVVDINRKNKNLVRVQQYAGKAG